MQKVHGPAPGTPIHGRHGNLNHPGALVLGLSLLLILCAMIYFGFFGTS